MEIFNTSLLGSFVQSKKIMIIEDEYDLLLLFKDFLTNKGYDVIVTAVTATNIIRDYQSFRPDLTIVDYKLPGGKNGLEAAQDILKVNSNALIILITAYEYVKDYLYDEKKANNQIRLVMKPIKLNTLEKFISSLLKNN
ncbi:MAG: response regulator [Nitrososphaeraceae archaeon]